MPMSMQLKRNNNNANHGNNNNNGAPIEMNGAGMNKESEQSFARVVTWRYNKY